MIFSALGLPVPARIDRKNALADIAGKMKGLDVREHEACTPETLEAMAPLVEADMELYNYALDLFEKNISALKDLQIEKGQSKI